MNMASNSNIPKNKIHYKLLHLKFKMLPNQKLLNNINGPQMQQQQPLNMERKNKLNRKINLEYQTHLIQNEMKRADNFDDQLIENIEKREEASLKNKKTSRKNSKKQKKGNSSDTDVPIKGKI
jgi:hypothetical protein